jgi:hypothetical protein
VAKRGRRAKARKQAKAIVDSNSLTDAYKKTHPKSSDESARKNAWRMFNEEVEAEIDRMLKLTKGWEVTKDGITKIIKMVVARYYAGKESGANALRAIELASKLIPEFVDRKAIQDYSKMSEDQIDNELTSKLRELGLQDELEKLAKPEGDNL